MKIHEVPSAHHDGRRVQAEAHREIVLDLAADHEIDSENLEVQAEVAETEVAVIETVKEADQFHQLNIKNSVILEIVRNPIDLGA